MYLLGTDSEYQPRYLLIPTAISLSNTLYRGGVENVSNERDSLT